MANTLQIKRGQESNIPTLSTGEPGFATDTGEFYVGDGTTNYRFIPGDQYVKTTSDATFNTVTGTNGLDAGSSRVTSVSDPTDDQDAATKSYVDAVEQGLDPKGSVRVATDGTNVDLTSSTDPGSIDGVTLSDGDRVLLKGQNTASENGIYVATTATDPTTWTRSADANDDADVTPGMFTFVEEGTTNNNKGFVLTTTGSITVGTTDLTFTQFSGAGQITAGTGLYKSGDTLNIDSDLNQLNDVGSDDSPADGDVLTWDNSVGEWVNSTPSTPVESVFGRTGSVTASADDYAASQITNDSSLSGSYVSDALDNLTASDLKNVNISSAASGQLLIYNATNGEYVNAGISAGTGINKTETDGSLSISTDDSNIDHNSLQNYSAKEHLDWTNDQSTNYTLNDANISKTAVTQYSYGYSDLSLAVHDTAQNGSTDVPISSNWAFDHNNAATGVHGAGSNTLLNSGSTIDCGTV